MDPANALKPAAMNDSKSSPANTPALQMPEPVGASSSPSLVCSPDSKDLMGNGAPKNVHSSAAQRVFAVAELRDIILEALLDVHDSRISAVRDLAACAAVNSHWTKSVMDSISIPARIFHTAPRPDDCLLINPDDPHPYRNIESGFFPTIYGCDGPAGCLYVDRDDLQFNPVLDDILALSKCMDKNFKHEDPDRRDGIFIHPNDICHPYAGKSMVDDIDKAQRTALNQPYHDWDPTNAMADDVTEHSESIERIRGELMDWMDEHPILTGDIPCWTPNDLTAPIFRNMFLTCPPVTEIAVYFGFEDSHDLPSRPHSDSRLCRTRLYCEDGVKVGHLIIAIASYHCRAHWCYSFMRCLCDVGNLFPFDMGMSGRSAWRFDDRHSIELAYNRKYDFEKWLVSTFVNVSRECEGVCEHEEDRRFKKNSTRSCVDDGLVDVGAGWMVDMLKGVKPYGWESTVHINL